MVGSNTRAWFPHHHNFSHHYHHFKIQSSQSPSRVSDVARKDSCKDLSWFSCLSCCQLCHHPPIHHDPSCLSTIYVFISTGSPSSVEDIAYVTILQNKWKRPAWGLNTCSWLSWRTSARSKPLETIFGYIMMQYVYYTMYSIHFNTGNDWFHHHHYFMSGLNLISTSFPNNHHQTVSSS